MTPGLAADITRTLRAIPEGCALEEQTRAAALARLADGVPLIREDVDRPDPHLVSYVVVTDGARLVLCHHRKAGLWLPTGGHVDPDETPRTCAVREAREELGIDLEGEQARLMREDPVFVTCQRTTGPRPHHDLSLWYMVHVAAGTAFDWDRGEFLDLRWVMPDALPPAREPQLDRFVAKARRLGLLAKAEVTA